MKQTFSYTINEITFTVTHAPNTTVAFKAIATGPKGETQKGDVSYAYLSQFKCGVNGLEFFYPKKSSTRFSDGSHIVSRSEGDFLSAAFPLRPNLDFDGGGDEPIDFGSGTVHVDHPPELSQWIVDRYREMLDAAMATVDAGESIDHGWRLRLAYEAGEHKDYYLLPVEESVARIREIRAQREAEEAEWDRRDQQRTIVVKIDRCWECGCTFIRGQLHRDWTVTRMDSATYTQAEAARREGVRRSLVGHEKEILSRVGFDPPPGSKFEFVSYGGEYYCGC